MTLLIHVKVTVGEVLQEVECMMLIVMTCSAWREDVMIREVISEAQAIILLLLQQVLLVLIDRVPRVLG